MKSPDISKKIIMQREKDFSKEKNLEAWANTKKRSTAFWQLVAVFGSLLILVFLLGLIPAWLSQRETARQRDAAQANLRLSQLQNRLATAAISARIGEYEPARLAASDFFTDIRAEVDRRESAFSDGQLESVRAILAERDEIITLLARYDKAAAERLTDLYLNYVQAINPPAKKTQ